MAPKPPRDRSPDADRIARQWDAAHRRDPRLTKGEFAQRIFPPTMDKYGRPVARSRRQAAGLLNAILAGRADDAASALLNLGARYFATVGGEDEDGNTVWVVNAEITTRQAPGDLDDSAELLALIRSAYDRRLGSPPNSMKQGEPPITTARIYRIPRYTPSYVADTIGPVRFDKRGYRVL